MHFACGIFEIGGFWCEIEKLIIFKRFRPNGARNRRKVDHSGSNAYLQTSVHLLGADFEKANRPHSSQQLLSPRDPPLLGGGRGAANRRKVDDVGSNALVHASVAVLGVDFEKPTRPHRSQEGAVIKNPR